MLKVILLIAALILLGLGIYYGRFLFTKKVVKEEIPPEMTKANIQILKTGTFRDIDFIHKGSGKALLLVDERGHKLLRLEDFQVTNGPDLYVYLTRNSNPSNKESLGDFLSLGRLKGNVGNQNYEITPEISGYDTVAIWCQQFSTLFTFAHLK